MKLTKQEWGIAFIMLIIVGIATFVVLDQQGLLSTISGNTEKLDCTSVQQCLDQFSAEGMPDGFLEQNGITISCDGGVCYAKK
jgi:hypothetical protein